MDNIPICPDPLSAGQYGSGIDAALSPLDPLLAAPLICPAAQLCASPWEIPGYSAANDPTVRTTQLQVAQPGDHPPAILQSPVFQGI